MEGTIKVLPIAGLIFNKKHQGRDWVRVGADFWLSPEVFSLSEGDKALLLGLASLAARTDDGLLSFNPRFLLQKLLFATVNIKTDRARFQTLADAGLIVIENEQTVA